LFNSLLASTGDISDPPFPTTASDLRTWELKIVTVGDESTCGKASVFIEVADR